MFVVHGHLYDSHTQHAAYSSPSCDHDAVGCAHVNHLVGPACIAADIGFYSGITVLYTNDALVIHNWYSLYAVSWPDLVFRLYLLRIFE